MRLETLYEVKEFLCDRYVYLQGNFDNTEHNYAKRYWRKQMLEVEVELDKVQSKIDKYNHITRRFL